MKIVLFGKNGQVGWELQRILPSLGQVVALDYDDLNLADLKAVQTRLDELRPDLIINASAYTAVDRAETERDVAMKVNGGAPGVMAEATRRSGGMLVHYSTDYVFDGERVHPMLKRIFPIR
jgi:dTDP-4-dehydrorhamnose reductase